MRKEGNLSFTIAVAHHAQRKEHCARVIPMAMREHDAPNNSEIGAKTGYVALEGIFFGACIEQQSMTGSATMRGNETRKAMCGAAQALAGHHPNAASHQARGFTLDMGRRAREHIRRIVYQDKDLKAIDRCQRHTRTLAYVRN
jgi:glycine cleavage system protein P-like pyridoxal-binding family